MMAEESLRKEVEIQPLPRESSNDVSEASSAAPVVEVMVPRRLSEQAFTTENGEYCALSRPSLKLLAIFLSVLTIILLCIATAPFCRESTCYYALVVPAVLLAALSVVACSGMCVISPEINHCCGCNRVEHKNMAVTGSVMGITFFILALAASYSWVAAMAYLFLFFCTIGFVGTFGLLSVDGAVVDTPRQGQQRSEQVGNTPSTAEGANDIRVINPLIIQSV